jgi:FMN reductase [NAD(P)H]
MEFADVLRRRRMVRSYTAEPVAREVVERIVERGRKAPSAGFSQGLSFVVVTDPEGRRAVARAGGEEWYTEQGMPAWLSQAPVHVVVCVREEAYHERYRRADKLQEDGTEIEWPVPWWYADAGKAIMLLLLCAVDEGLGAGMFGFHDAADCREALGIPADVTPVAAVTIGHPGENEVPGSRSKFPWKPAEEVIRWERW